MSRAERGAWTADPYLLDALLGPRGAREAAHPLSAFRPWAQRRPVDRYDALLRAAAGDEPEESISEQDELREVLADALEALTEEEQWIFHMLTTVRLSLRFVGGVLGVPKTTLARRRDKIREYLMKRLAGEEVVQDWLKRFH